MSIKASRSLPASVTISSHQESSSECALREAPLLLLFSNTVTYVGVRRMWGGQCCKWKSEANMKGSVFSCQQVDPGN